MAALCNKTASMSPPPLADAAVGKGFHPWKNKSSPEAAGSGSRSQPGHQGTNPATTASSSYSSPTHGATTPSPGYGTWRIRSWMKRIIGVQSRALCAFLNRESDNLKPISRNAWIDETIWFKMRDAWLSRGERQWIIEFINIVNISRELPITSNLP